MNEQNAPSENLVPHRGTTILVLGILGFVVPCVGGILGIIAWVMGKGDLAKIKAGTMDPEGASYTQIGMILGIVSTILWIIGVVFFILIMMGGIVTAAANAEGILDVGRIPGITWVLKFG